MYDTIRAGGAEVRACWVSVSSYTTATVAVEKKKKKKETDIIWCFNYTDSHQVAKMTKSNETIGRPCSVAWRPPASCPSDPPTLLVRARHRQIRGLSGGTVLSCSLARRKIEIGMGSSVENRGLRRVIAGTSQAKDGLLGSATSRFASNNCIHN